MAGEGEVALGSDWALTLYDTSELVQVAADHLRAFLAQSLGTELACCGAAKRVVFDVDPDGIMNIPLVVAAWKTNLGQLVHTGDLASFST